MKCRRTKIIATLGPRCSNKKLVQTFVNMGVNCFRINLSHGTLGEKQSYFDLVKSISIAENKRPAIIADIAGPKIRISGLDKSFELKKDDKITVSNEKKGLNIIPVSSNVAFR